MRKMPEQRESNRDGGVHKGRGEKEEGSEKKAKQDQTARNETESCSSLLT